MSTTGQSRPVGELPKILPQNRVPTGMSASTIVPPVLNSKGRISQERGAVTDSPTRFESAEAGHPQDRRGVAVEEVPPGLAGGAAPQRAQQRRPRIGKPARSCVLEHG